MNATTQDADPADRQSPVTKEEIQQYLAEEDLAYQRIELPFGLAVEGNPRTQVKQIAFEGDITGKSVLDVGSFLGAFCIEALNRGASRAVGLELSRQRFYQAKTLARFLGLRPEYLRKDVEDYPLDEKFDIVLCLNVLHHLHDPIGALRYLSRICNDRLVLECASLGRHDRKKHGIGFLSGLFLNRHATIYVGAANRAKQPQTYFFTRPAIRNVLQGHIKQFHSIDIIDSEFKGRFIVKCSKLRIKRMMLVSGCTSSGKSTLQDQIQKNELSEQLGYDDFSDATTVNINAVYKKPLNEIFPQRVTEKALYHYDLSQIEKRKLHTYHHDPATDLLRCVEQIDIVVAAPPLEILKQQMMESEIETKDPKKRKRPLRHYAQIQQSGFLLDLYQSWIRFCETIPFVRKQYVLCTEQGGERRLIKCRDAEDISNRIEELYGHI